MKKVLISVMCGFLLVGIVGCDNQEQTKEKPILYSYSVEDLDYTKDSYKGYSIIYTANISGYETTISNRLELKSGSSCNYYGSYKNETGTTSVLVDSSCNYTIDGNKVSVKIGSVKQIYTPSNSGYSKGYASDTTYENNVVINGELSETGKLLKVGDLNYYHVSYLLFIEKGMENILIDPKTDKQYKTNGAPAGTSDPEYVLNNSLILDDYQIINKSAETNK